MNWLHAGGQTVPNMLQIEGESLWKSQISPGGFFWTCTAMKYSSVKF